MKYKYGVILGRFQPFHKGHLKYLLKALKFCEILYIGITTPGEKLTKYEPQDPYRIKKENNPFNFKERKIMILKSLMDLNVDLQKIKFVEFKPSKLTEWFLKIPKDATYLILVVNETDLLKAEQMKEQGLSVAIIGNLKNRKHQAFNIRQRILVNKDWKTLVPDAVYNYLNTLNVLSRFKK